MSSQSINNTLINKDIVVTLPYKKRSDGYYFNYTDFNFTVSISNYIFTQGETYDIIFENFFEYYEWRTDFTLKNISGNGTDTLTIQWGSGTIENPDPRTMPQQNSNDINDHWTDYDNLVRTGQEFRITVKHGIFSTKKSGSFKLFYDDVIPTITQSQVNLSNPTKREYRIDISFIEGNYLQTGRENINSIQLKDRNSGSYKNLDLDNFGYETLFGTPDSIQELTITKLYLNNGEWRIKVEMVDKANNNTMVEIDIDVDLTADPVDDISVAIANTNSIPCFIKGTPILTDKGYVNIELLTENDTVVLHGGGKQKIKKIHTATKIGNKDYAPYYIEKLDLIISPLHAIMIDCENELWMIPAYTKGLKQVMIGDFIKYYNIELENWLTDYLIIKSGIVVESYGVNYHKNLGLIEPMMNKKRNGLYEIDKKRYKKRILERNVKKLIN